MILNPRHSFVFNARTYCYPLVLYQQKPLCGTIWLEHVPTYRQLLLTLMWLIYTRIQKRVVHCLQQFSVGTDLSKSCRSIQARTTPREYCLLCNFKLNNPLTSTANLITTAMGKKCININNNDNNWNNDMIIMIQILLPVLIIMTTMTLMTIIPITLTMNHNNHYTK